MHWLCVDLKGLVHEVSTDITGIKVAMIIIITGAYLWFTIFLQPTNNT